MEGWAFWKLIIISIVLLITRSKSKKALKHHEGDVTMSMIFLLSSIGFAWTFFILLVKTIKETDLMSKVIFW